MDKVQCRDRHISALIDEKIRKREKFFGVEVAPGQRYSQDSPLFYSVPCFGSFSRVLEETKHLRGNVLVHLTSELKRNDAEKFLNDALVLGRTNVFVLQGNNPSDDRDFSYAADLVSFIRQHYGKKFSICVSGYPEMHPRSESKELDLFYLKKKVEAGADFIITQFFWDSQVFVDFVRDCRKIGISVPIIPGILSFESWRDLERMSKFCKVEIPGKILHEVKSIEDDKAAMQKYGVVLAKDIIRDVLPVSYGYHLFGVKDFSVAEEINAQLETSKNV